MDNDKVSPRLSTSFHSFSLFLYSFLFFSNFLSNQTELWLSMLLFIVSVSVLFTCCCQFSLFVFGFLCSLWLLRNRWKRRENFGTPFSVALVFQGMKEWTGLSFI